MKREISQTLNREVASLEQKPKRGESEERTNSSSSQNNPRHIQTLTNLRREIKYGVGDQARHRISGGVRHLCSQCSFEGANTFLIEKCKKRDEVTLGSLVDFGGALVDGAEGEVRVVCWIRGVEVEVKNGYGESFRMKNVG